MDRLPRDPATFRELVEADLRRAARLIVKVQDELDPQLRIATPEGDYWIAVTLPADDYGRRTILRALETFMVWKQAQAFTLASSSSPTASTASASRRRSGMPALRGCAVCRGPGRQRASVLSSGCRRPRSIPSSPGCCRRVHDR
jgi:hypothetical protein